MLQVLKHPNAWVPFVLTAGIVGVIFLYLTGILPPDPAGDEGTGAHLFQLWLVLEFFAVIFFTIKWIPLKPKEALEILGLQILFAFVPLSIVFSLHL